MENFDLYQTFQESELNAVPLFYKGPLFHDVIFNLAQIVKSRMNEHDRKRNKVLAVLVELAENIKLYSEDKLTLEEKTAGIGLIALKETDEGYFLFAVNKVKNERGVELKTKCDFINTLDRKSLNELYNGQREESILLGARGGSIGLIEMARRSSNLLKVKIQPFDNVFSYFTIQVKINKDH